MKISVRVKPRSKIDQVEKTAEGEFVVRVKEPPLEGRANVAAARELADYFGVPKSGVRLLHGAASKNKIFEVDI